MTHAIRDEKSTESSVMLHFDIPQQPRKEPRQSRSIALVCALKQAGRQILEEEGREAMTVFRLADRSGVAISSIYSYFPTMDALVAAIFEDYREEVREQMQTAITALPADASLFDGILVTLKIGLAAHYRKTRFDPAFSVRSTRYDELVRLDLVKAKKLWSSTATSTLMARFANEIRGKDKEKIGFLALQMLLALPRAMLLDKPQYLVDPDTPILIARMLHALLTSADD